MPTKERAAKEAVRDRIREIAFGVAEHVAGDNMVEVEPREHGSVRFSSRTEVVRCSCGLPMAPIPTFTKRYGWLPTWYCSVCHLAELVVAMEKLAALAALSEQA